MARPMPVLPEVGSMMVPPGLSAPRASAASTMDSAMRSLIEPPGLLRSDLIQTWMRAAEQAVDADMRGVANGLQDVVGFHGFLLGWVKPPVLSQ
jgi:hypothetical protein